MGLNCCRRPTSVLYLFTTSERVALNRLLHSPMSYHPKYNPRITKILVVLAFSSLVILGLALGLFKHRNEVKRYFKRHFRTEEHSSEEYFPPGFTVYGIDVSGHQGKIDWIKFHQHRQESGIQFVFIKATQGAAFKDAYFAYNLFNARQIGMATGVYHYYDMEVDPVEQAEHYIRTVELVEGDLPPVLDIEGKVHNPKNMRNDVRTWLELVQEHYGVAPIIYCNLSFKRDYLSDPYFDNYPLWLAHYTDSFVYDRPWHFWQSSEKGRLPGICTAVDLNSFNGTLEEFEALLIAPEF